jgi:hypothetical protein
MEPCEGRHPVDGRGRRPPFASVYTFMWINKYTFGLGRICICPATGSCPARGISGAADRLHSPGLFQGIIIVASAVRALLLPPTGCLCVPPNACAKGIAN